MRILLISPPYRRFMGILEDSFPLGLGYIGAILDQRGHFVRIYNADFDKDIESLPYSYKHSFSHQHDVVKALNNDSHYVWKEIKEKIESLEPNYAEINIFNPLPGTKLCEYLQDRSILPQNIQWQNFSQESIENFYTKGMSKEEFKELALEMAEKFDAYNRDQAYKKELKEKKQQLAEAHAAFGGFYLRHNQVKEAICELEKAAKMDPKYILVQYHLASCHQNIGNFKKAIEGFQKVLQIKTTKKERFWAGAHFYMGEIYQMQGNLKKAKAEFEACLEYNPGHRKAKEMVGNNLQEKPIESKIH